MSKHAWLPRAVTFVTGTVAVAVCVIDIFGSLPDWISMPSITSAVLGLLIIWLMVDHQQTGARLARIEDLDLHARLLGFSKAAFHKVDRALTDYAGIWNNWRFQKKDQSPVGRFVDAYMTEHFEMLTALNGGRIEVSHRQASHVQHLILHHMRSRFDAVSDRDLRFWSRTLSSDYHAAIRSAQRKSNTIVNRIFIVTLKDLAQHRQLITKILREQHQSGFGWGVAIWDEIDFHIRSDDNNRLDFAFSGKDGVLTYFVRDKAQQTRSLEVVVPIPSNVSEFARQRDLYAHLVAECWLVNSRFSETFNDILNDRQRESATAVATKSNNKILNRIRSDRAWLDAALFEDSSLAHPRKPVVESHPQYFLLLTKAPDTIERDLDKLEWIVKESRSIPG